MSVLDSIKNFLIGEEEGEDYEPLVDEENEAETVDVAQERRNREFKFNTTATVQIVLACPTDYSEVKSIGDDLNNQKTVLLNLEKVKADEAKRIMDFLSGVAYANGATIKMTATKTFVIMPKNVGFSGVDLMSEIENSGYSF